MSKPTPRLFEVVLENCGVGVMFLLDQLEREHPGQFTQRTKTIGRGAFITIVVQSTDQDLLAFISHLVFQMQQSANLAMRSRALTGRNVKLNRPWLHSAEHLLWLEAKGSLADPGY